MSSDAALVQRLLQRDVRAFEQLYDRHSRIVYALVLRILQQASTAEEVVQDVFLQLWRNAGQYQAGRGPFVPWLLTLARNRALDHLRLKSERQRRREDQTEELPAIAQAPEYEKALDEKRRAEVVRSLMGSLERAAEESHRDGLLRRPEPQRNRERPARAAGHGEKLDPERIVAIEGRIASSIVSEHDQFRELIEAYALGALDAAERAALEAHLAAGCPECAKALEEARWLVTQLAYLAPPAEPSDMLRARLLRTVRAEAEGCSAQPRPGETVQRRDSLLAVGRRRGAAAADRCTRPGTRGRCSRKFTDVNARAAAELKQRAAVATGIDRGEARSVDPHRSRARRRSTSGRTTRKCRSSRPCGIRSWEFMSRPEDADAQEQSSSAIVADLRRPGGKPMPSHTFWPDANGKIDEMVDDPPEVMAQTKALAITEEPAGGSPQPTSTPMWVGGVS